MTRFRHFVPLARIHLRMLFHFLFPVRLRVYFPTASLLLIGAGLLALEFLGFRRVFLYFNRLEDVPAFFVRFLLERLTGLVFLISYSMIFMSGIINGLSVFFLSADLPLLHSLPIPRWKILTARFLENWFTSCYLVVAFLLVFVACYCYSFRLPWSRYLAGLVLLAVFTVSPVAAGSAAVGVLMRFFPARRIYQAVTFIAGVFLAAVVIAVRWMQPERLLYPADTDDFVRLIKDLTLPSISHLPSSWAAHVLVYADSGPLLQLTAFAAVSLLLLAATFRLVYTKAYVGSQENRSLRRTAGRAAVSARPSRRRGVTAALMLKDFKLFLRDATQWSQLFLLAALVVVYLVNIKNLAIQLPMVRWAVSFINLGLAGFVLSALSVRFLYPSVSNEGRSFWIIRTLPLSYRRLLWCKYLIYFVPFLLFTQALVYFSNRILAVPAFFLHLSMANIFAIAFALTGLAVGVGALMPNFKADHPSKIAIGPGGVLYMFLSFIYLSMMLTIQIRPVWYYVIERPEQIHATAYAGAALLLTLLVALVPMEWGARRLERSEYQP